MTYTFYEDPGHGWLEVPLAEIAELEIADKISGYSYMNNRNAYLEEDCDMAVFLEAKLGPPIEGADNPYKHWHDAYHTDYSATKRWAPEIFIRRLGHYHPALVGPAPKLIGAEDIARQMVFELAAADGGK